MYRSPRSKIRKTCTCGETVVLWLHFGTRDYSGNCKCGIRWERRSGITQRALDGGDSAPQLALSTPEVLSPSLASSTPPHRQ